MLKMVIVMIVPEEITIRIDSKEDLYGLLTMDCKLDN